MTNEMFTRDNNVYRGAPDASNDHESERPNNQERILAELRETPLTELMAAPEMVDCARVAIEKNLGGVDLPPEISLLAGVRIDDIGAVDEYSKNEDSTRDGFPESFRRQGRPRGEDLTNRVGTYYQNNGTVEYVDALGRQYVAPASDHLLDALVAAGYKAGEGWVNCSNTSFPADLDRARLLIQAREVASQLNVLKQLKALGIDKMGEAGDLLGEFDDPKSEVSQRVKEKMDYVERILNDVMAAREAAQKDVHTANREERQRALQKQLEVEGALPVEAPTVVPDSEPERLY